MIRPAELAGFLDTLARTLAHELRPELRSSKAQKSADYLLEVLVRLGAQARAGEQIAAQQGERWARLLGKGSVALPAPGDAQAQLDRSMTALQEALIAGRLAPQLADEQWFAEAVRGGLDYWEAVEASVAPPAAPTQATAADEDPQALRQGLSRYFERRYPQLPADLVESLKIAPGGNTKRTALFALRPNPLLPRRLVLRQDRPMNMTGTRVTDEFPIVERLHGLGLKVPRPLLLESDATLLDGAFMVVAEVEDAVPAGTYFAEDRAHLPSQIGPQFGRDAAAELAKLHRATAVDDAPHAAQAWEARLQGIAAAEARWKALNRPAASLVVDLGFEWLRRNPLGPGRPRSLIHGDYSVHNMMARAGRLAAVLDWELAEEDDPAIDLAEARMMMTADTISWEEFARAYIAAGGEPRACDTRAVNYYCVWSYTAKFGLMVAEARNAYLQGLRTDALMAAVAANSMERILLYAARSLALAAGGARNPSCD
jgi:aminoglycoside phosphotransferase (APT) family kinase protein